MFAFYLVTAIFPPEENCARSPLEPALQSLATYTETEEYSCQQQGEIIVEVCLILVIKGKSIFTPSNKGNLFLLQNHYPPQAEGAFKYYSFEEAFMNEQKQFLVIIVPESASVWPRKGEDKLVGAHPFYTAV